MIDDQRFEIQSAFDLLPHVVGCSWATIWFRLNKIKKPFNILDKRRFYQNIQLLQFS